MAKSWILLRDLKRILKNNIRKIVWVSITIWFIFFLFNLFFSISSKFNQFNDMVTDKIWIYFYIDDSWDSKDIYKRIINIKDELATHNIEVNFASKQDAFNFLENKIPEITKNFDKFGIDNPLPSTLYVMFHDENEYNVMKDIIIKNKDIILNIKDIDKWATLQEQENRSLKTLKIIKTIKHSIYFMIAIISIILISFTQYLLRTFFFEFYKELHIKKLLWATHKNTNSSFLLTLLFILTIWFLIWLALIIITFSFLHTNLSEIGIHIELYHLVPYLLLTYVWFWVITLWLWHYKLNSFTKNF